MSDDIQTGALGQDDGTPQAPAPEAPPVQSVEPAGSGQEPGGQTEPESKTLTLAEAQAMVHAEVEKAKNEMRSYADKGRNQALKAADEAKAAITKLREFGQNISEEDEAKMIAAAKDKAVQEAYAAEDDTPAPQQQTPMPQEVQYVAEALGQHDLRMQGKYGVELAPEDPEVKQFQITGDPEKDKANVEAMYAAKKARLSNGTPPGGENDNSNNDATPPNVRVPSSRGQVPRQKLTSKQKLNKGLSGDWSQGKS